MLEVGFFFINIIIPVNVYNVYFLLALVVVDNMKAGGNMKDVEEVSSDDSTIDIMSSGDEHIDITNDLDPPPEAPIVLYNSDPEFDQEYVFQLISNNIPKNKSISIIVVLELHQIQMYVT